MTSGASSKYRLCIVEDDEIMGESLGDRFRLEGFDPVWCRTAREARVAIPSGDYAVVISDVRLPDHGGDDLFEELQAHLPALPPFVFITGFGSVDRAVDLLKKGAADYITKPFDLDQLVEKVRAICVTQGQRRQVPRDQGTLGISSAMRKIEAGIPTFAGRARTILVTGESGVGKEYVALAIHRHARESEDCPFVAVNCAAVPEGLLEAELFGYEKGAFTGAVRSRKGYFEQADCGTLFLDEIGEMPPSMQSKLLRAIQDRRITRIGGEAPIDVDFRLVCATNRDLRQMVREGRFREDLYYRINVIHLRVPPLRDRQEDILWFAQRFLDDLAGEPGSGPRLHPASERALVGYSWPGNLRELKHCMERAFIMSGGERVLRPDALFDDSPTSASEPPPEARSLNEFLVYCERDFIARALEKNGWQIGHTAEELGISRKNLWEKMRKLGLSESRAPGDAPA